VNDSLVNGSLIMHKKRLISELEAEHTMQKIPFPIFNLLQKLQKNLHSHKTRLESQ